MGNPFHIGEVEFSAFDFPHTIFLSLGKSSVSRIINNVES